MRNTVIGALAGITLMASPVAASEFGFVLDDTKDNYADKELKAGDWSAAEAALLGSEVAPEDQIFAKLNLAFVYSTTGRKDQAVALYKEILSGEENPYALLRNGEPSRIKTIAKTALDRLSN